MNGNCVIDCQASRFRLALCRSHQNRNSAPAHVVVKSDNWCDAALRPHCSEFHPGAQREPYRTTGAAEIVFQ